MRGRNRALWECPEHMSQIEKAGEGFVEEVVFGLSPEGEGKEHSRLRGEI